MRLRDILVYVDATARSDARVSVAAALARRHHAVLSGIYPIEPTLAEPLLSIAVPFEDGDTASASNSSRDAALRAERYFRAALVGNGISGEWHSVEGVPEQIVSKYARHADLLIVGQSDPRDPVDIGTEVTTQALLTSGRPVLVVPYAGNFQHLGANIVVAWTDTREATRALNDVLPLLSAADQVTILSVNPPKDAATAVADGGTADVIRHLARRGVAATAARIYMDELAVGDAILNRAFDLGADLLVCGAYGHSKVREFILGGVTRGLLDHMTMPVFMSH